ncbi:SMI1/KNR4 family protein [Sutcliffiella horikoshii]|uniref:SMI1/KNR4 family protein n=1 Tax=Sutcliffiella horikoshii TaxID=79883 RepID=UPI001CBEB8B2|nr:SMI1/KNR4 family protein [Sutcliffiella horikoshii]UAL47147.1 SMI1/KNR4 family protein [Sutcliffiella horikoshii]
MNQKLLSMIKNFKEKRDFSGEVSVQIIELCESKLEVVFPDEYREFLLKFGSGGICSVSVLGIENESYFSVEETTKKFRGLGVPHKYVVIENVDEFINCLNTEQNYNIIRWDEFSKKEVERYHSFDEYLEDSFQEAIDNW